jgi:hypothetical protein
MAEAVIYGGHQGRKRHKNNELSIDASAPAGTVTYAGDRSINMSPMAASAAIAHPEVIIVERRAAGSCG